MMDVDVHNVRMVAMSKQDASRVRMGIIAIWFMLAATTIGTLGIFLNTWEIRKAFEGRKPSQVVVDEISDGCVVHVHSE